jgi:hypothetical protein
MYILEKHSLAVIKALKTKMKLRRSSIMRQMKNKKKKKKRRRKRKRRRRRRKKIKEKYYRNIKTSRL